jgi:hypothetical protein
MNPKKKMRVTATNADEETEEGVAFYALPRIPPEGWNHTTKTYDNKAVASARESKAMPWNCIGGGLPYDAMSFPTRRTLCMAKGLEELKAVTHEIWKWPVADQARYADAVCRWRTADAAWVAQQMSDANLEVFWDRRWKLSTCNIANVAYTACYAPTEELRLKALHAHQKYVTWRRSGVGQLVEPYQLFTSKELLSFLPVMLGSILMAVLMHLRASGW